MTTEEKLREIHEYFHAIRGATTRHDKNHARLFNNFTHQELHAILYIGENGASKMSDIAEDLQLSLSSISGIVDSLVAKKMAGRIRSSEDRRIVQVVLTAEAARLYRDAMNKHVDFVRIMLNTLNSREQDQLLALFRKIATSLKDKRR